MNTPQTIDINKGNTRFEWPKDDPSSSADDVTLLFSLKLSLEAITDMIVEYNGDVDDDVNSVVRNGEPMEEENDDTVDMDSPELEIMEDEYIVLSMRDDEIVEGEDDAANEASVLVNFVVILLTDH